MFGESREKALWVRIKRLPHAGDLDLPAYESAGAAGCDLRAAVADGQALLVQPGDRAIVPTGIIMAIPEGWEGQVRPRSGLAAKHGVTCLNSPGTIDSDYRGEIKVILINMGAEAFAVRRGDRIAQIVFAPAVRAHFEEASEIDATVRGAGGFGSTGS